MNSPSEVHSYLSRFKINNKIREYYFNNQALGWLGKSNLNKMCHTFGFSATPIQSMKWNLMPDVATLDDARLVALGRDGDRDAFGQLVTRYQSPVCALAYSACGDITQSQDLAQETFIIAWRKLADLHEPAKFKSWLFGITRNLINNAARRQTRNPLAAAEPLDETLAAPAAISTPVGHAMSKEEEEILWRSLEKIPETYREPLVLFYREHESIERVAEVMELSEEAARQRLSRGRKLLHEQITAFVEGALKQSGPGSAFTLGVLAALPAMTISAKAATFSAVAKGGAVAKSVGLIGLFGAILAPLIAFYGMWADYRLRKKTTQSKELLHFLKIYYIGIAVSVAVMVLLATLLMNYGGVIIKRSPALFACLMTGTILGYSVLVGIGGRWFYRTVKKLQVESTPSEAAAKPKFPGWEYRSRFELFGLPFIHIRIGGRRGASPIREWKPVKAWIAADDACAYGILFAYGSMAIAPVSIGAFSVGLISYGAMSIGALAIGGFSFGAWAFGGFAFGWQAFGGGCAIAWDAAWSGTYAIGHSYALSDIASPIFQPHADSIRSFLESIPFFRIAHKASPYLFWLLWVWMIPMMISMVAQGYIAARNRRQEQRPTVKPQINS
jgi:RNA polymerase sigma factor (sigma-70 family)